MPALIGGLALFAVGAVTVALLLTVRGRRLQHAAHRMRLGEYALDAIPHAVFVVDALDGGRRNVYVNAAYSSLTGYPAAEALSSTFDAFSIFADPAAVAALDVGGGMGSRVAMRRRDGTTAAGELELRSAPGQDGARYLIGVLAEVPAMERRAEQAGTLPPSSPPLASGTARPTDAFLSYLSHELRSPLNACVMWLDVLALAPQSDNLPKAIDAIKRNLTRQTRLVNDLSDAAKVAVGALDVRLEPVDVAALLQRHIDAWQLLAIGKQLTFEHRIDSEAASVNADPQRLSQALTHLFESAVISTPAGGRIALRLHTATDVCIIELADEGAGLSDEDAANLSTPLWRAPTSSKSRAGLGLGLAIAHYVTAQHGGTLTAASAASGVTLVLTLPLAAGATEPAEPTVGGRDFIAHP